MSTKSPFSSSTKAGNVVFFVCAVSGARGRFLSFEANKPPIQQASLGWAIRDRVSNIHTSRPTRDRPGR